MALDARHLLIAAKVVINMSFDAEVKTSENITISLGGWVQLMSHAHAVKRGVWHLARLRRARASVSTGMFTTSTLQRTKSAVHQRCSLRMQALHRQDQPPLSGRWAGCADMVLPGSQRESCWLTARALPRQPPRAPAQFETPLLCIRAVSPYADLVLVAQRCGLKRT